MNQEEIVDNIILDMLESKYPGVKKKISIEANKSKRRNQMLAFLGDDRVLFNGYQDIVSNNPQRPCIEYSKDILNMLREYVKIADVEVKRFGEVMTPFTLVDDMLNTLPDDVWSNPNLKWLDPCNGIGTFPCIIVDRLMVGLKDVIPNDCDRYKHIIENMIYVCELQVKNMFLYHCAFDREDKYDLNTYWGSFLDENFDEHMKNVWGVEKFDIVVANPPYNSGSNNKGSSHVLWDKFVEKSLTILIEGGYLNMVHPSNWRFVDGPFSNLKKTMFNKTIIYLELHSKTDGKKTFGASTTYDFYCLKNVENNNHKTKIKFEDGKTTEINIQNLPFIPNANLELLLNLIANKNEDSVKVISNSSYHTQREYISKTENNDFKYPCVYYTYADGSIRFNYSSVNKKGHFDIPKVIFSQGISHPIIDKNGEYGMCEFAYAIVDEIENLENIQKALLDPKFIELMKYVDGVSGQRYNRKVIAKFRKDFWKQVLTN
jgi:hypothetical protein